MRGPIARRVGGQENLLAGHEPAQGLGRQGRKLAFGLGFRRLCRFLAAAWRFGRLVVGGLGRGGSRRLGLGRRGWPARVGLDRGRRLRFGAANGRLFFSLRLRRRFGFQWRFDLRRRLSGGRRMASRFVSRRLFGRCTGRRKGHLRSFRGRPLLPAILFVFLWPLFTTLSVFRCQRSLFGADSPTHQGIAQGSSRLELSQYQQHEQREADCQHNRGANRQPRRALRGSRRYSGTVGRRRAFRRAASLSPSKSKIGVAPLGKAGLEGKAGGTGGVPATWRFFRL